MLALIQATNDFDVIARQTVQFITPEVLLTIFACAALVLDVMLPADRKKIVAWVSFGGVLLTMLSVAILYFDVVKGQAPRTGFFGMLIFDPYAVAFKIIFLTGAALSILLSVKYLEIEGEQRG